MGRLSPTGTAMATDLDTSATDTTDWATGVTTMARGRLRLSPRLLLTPTFCMVATTDMDSDTLATVAMEATITARGRLRPSLRLTPTFCTVATTAMDSATAMVLATGPDTTGDKLL